jgi:hypothetical protein
MRELTVTESAYLDDNGEHEEGAVAVETTIGELADVFKAGTQCGTIGNACFCAMSVFSDRLVRGWFDPQSYPNPTMCGMVHVQCDEPEAEQLSALAAGSEGSLRPDGPSQWPEFYVFEIE